MLLKRQISSQALQNASRQWGWHLIVGLLLTFLGAWAVINSFIAGIASVMLLGFMLLIAGLLQAIGAFQTRGSGPILPMLLVGILDVVLGLILSLEPGMGMLVITIMLALFFIAVGTTRLLGGLTLRFPHHGWVAFSGGITLVLGLLILLQWPASAWFIGFMIGLNFLFMGASWTVLALRLKNL